MLKGLKLAVKLPLSALWDAVTFCSCGMHSATESTLHTYQKEKQVEEIAEYIEVANQIADLKDAIRKMQKK